ncbi:hypothetical protein A3D62_00065 [Candidatus Kaiserbacteria bacterium RIFCSPHIGHO2_02_FULL_49_11]|uniref:DUF192 domain-containing protein n=1 Tax=Candidatus Kaiserbacteria bacterium RIFCSPHIGHO2_02_FULL_49_11 TaxID=1798489 RepID=A0A1F6D0D8_9BACT|nr:MAG: hypothetical protein A3D62_00065 [Candidatus Kaiserbacteria bacterium RIFCSPHIGHO2_02_FULL_49_11]
MNKFFIFVVLAILLLSPAFLSKLLKAPEEENTIFSMPLSTVTIGQTIIAVAIADTHETRRKGLSDLLALQDGHGLFFAFPSSGTYGIWMKDMQFSIDIAWLDEKLQIIDVARDIAPETYPAAFYPKAPARYILELPAGFLKAHRIEIGNTAMVEVRQL